MPCIFKFIRRTQLTIRLRLLCHKRARVYRRRPLGSCLTIHDTIIVEINFMISVNIENISDKVYEKDNISLAFFVHSKACITSNYLYLGTTTGEFNKIGSI